MRSLKSFFIICIVCFVLCLAGTAAAQIPGHITGMTLEPESLTMEIEEVYQFHPEFTAEGNDGFVNEMLFIFSSDENVVQPGSDVNSIIAVGGGEAEVIFFTDRFEFSAVCKVTVNGAPKSVIAKGGTWQGPNKKQLAKVTDPGLKEFYLMLEKPSMSNAASALSKQNKFLTLVSVTKGRAESLAEAMRELGMEHVKPFKRSDLISVVGTAEQYLVLLKSDNVLSVQEDIRYTAQASEVSGDDMFRGRAEELSHFTDVYEDWNGAPWLSGEGTTVAILDTGINPDHEQFTGKEAGSIIYPACFSYTGYNWYSGSSYSYDYYYSGVCQGGYSDESHETAEIDYDIVEHPENFQHGTHVAAIAAGKNGVARKANIIPVNIFAEVEIYYYDYAAGYYSHFWNALTPLSNQIQALEYILDLIEDHPDLNLAAVNMSIGGGQYKSACKKDDREIYFQELMAHGVIVAVSSGNNGFDGSVGAPGCAPSAFTVGSLLDSSDPVPAYYSNHAKMVDIMAPGTQIVSAIPDDTDTYDTWNGTSMAAPMVTGAVALLRQQFPNDVMSANEIEMMLTSMSGKTAVRNKVSVPVLDLQNFVAIGDFFENGPFTDKGILGGNKLIQMDFAAIPYNTTYKIQVWKANEDGSCDTGVKPVKSISGKNLKTAKITGLVPEQLYLVRVDIGVVFGKETYQLDPFWRFGMPMAVPAAKDNEFEIAVTDAEYEDEDLELQFIWNKPVDEYGYMAQWVSPFDGEEEYAYNDAGVAWEYNVPVTANFYKYIDLYLDNDLVPDGDPYTLYSLPTAVDAFPIAAPDNYFDKKLAWGKLWLSFYDAEPYITTRVVQIDQLKVDLNGETIYDDTTGDPIVQKTLKTLKADVKKYPHDIVISGLPSNVPLQVKVSQIGVYNKKTYTSASTVVFWEYRSSIPVYNSEYASYPLFAGDIGGVSVSAGDQSALVKYGKDLTVDGWRFEIKPIDPDHTKLVQEAATAKNPDAYTITGLTNGTVYKLRLQKTLKAGKGTVLSTYYPGELTEEYNEEEDEYEWTWDWTRVLEDTKWEGIVFIPLADPDVRYASGYDWDDGASNRWLGVKTDTAADGFVFLTVGNDGNGPSLTRFTWADDAKDGDVAWVSGDDSVMGSDVVNRTSVVMLYKDYEDYSYYGPAVILDPVNLNGDQSYISTGPKAADVIDLSSVPEFANAAQIDGQVFSAFTQNEIGTKAAEGADEISLMDDFAVEADEAVSEEEVIESEAADAEEAAEVPEEDEFEEYPEIISEDLDAEDPLAEKAVDPEEAADEAEELEEDEFESYPEILYLDLEEDAEEAEPEAEPEPVKTPAPKKQEKKENGFSLFMFGN